MRPLPALILFLGASLIGQSQQTAVQALQVAHRYNDQRVVFLLKKVSDDSINPGRDSKLVESAALPPPVASQSGMQLWQWRNSEFWDQHQQVVSEAPRSQRWLLFAGEGRRFHFKIEKHLVAQMNCEAGIVAMGLVEPEDLPAFRQVDEMQYLALPDVSGAMLNRADPLVIPALLEEFPETSAGSNPVLEAALEGLLARELPKVQQAAEQDPVARRSAMLRTWRSYDERLVRGDARLSYDRKKLRISPNGVPRLYVRAKWTLDEKTVFLLSAWFRTGDELTVEEFDVGASHFLRTPEFQHFDLDLDWVGDIFNIFDWDNDGWGELIIDRQGYESYGFELFEYSEDGLSGPLASYSYGC